MLIDTHSHLNFNAFKTDLDDVIEKSFSEGVWMINVGTKYETSRKAVEISEKYKKGVFCAIGLHPIYSASDIVKIKTDPEEGSFLAKKEIFEKEKYRALAKSKKVVAIGEIGLDYYYKPKTKRKFTLFKEKQKETFLLQLELALELKLPVILHCRMAHEDLLELLKNFQRGKGKLSGVIHCFTGNWKEAKEYLKMGFYLGFNGIIFKLNLDEIIKKAPKEKILVETDCPYLTPPQAKVERNEPRFVKYVVERIAEIRGETFEKVSYFTTENAKRLFQI